MNAIIDGSIIKKYWIDFRDRTFPSFSSFEILAVVKVDITVTSSASGNVLSKSYNGFANMKLKAFSDFSPWKIAIDEALLAMIKDFTMDPDFIERLNRSEKK